MWKRIKKHTNPNLATKVTNSMPIVAIQAFDKDKILVLNNDDLMTAMDMIGKIHQKVNEIKHLLLQR